MRRFVAWVARAIVLLALAVAGGTFIPRPLWTAGPASGLVTRTVVVLSGPIHTDIAIPLDIDTRQDFAFLQQQGIPVDDPFAEWLIIGWGGRDFYLETPTWADLKLKPVLKALTIDKSVLRVDIARSLPSGRPDIVPFDISDEGMRRLVTYVKDSFIEVDGVPAMVAGGGYGTFDRFYEAKGYFNALVGCNTWTAGALRTAGLKTGWWNPLPQSLNLSLSLFN